MLGTLGGTRIVQADSGSDSRHQNEEKIPATKNRTSKQHSLQEAQNELLSFATDNQSLYYYCYTIYVGPR